MVKNVPVITEQIDEYLESLDCPMREQMQIDVAIDEIITNVSMYAYGDSNGIVTIEYDKLSEGGIKLVFTDTGVPFDPTKHEDPDTSLSAEERRIGGLGIYMVKKSMDELIYERKGNRNVFTVTKHF